MLAFAVGAALGAHAPKQGRDHSGILLPKSAFDHGARKLAGKTGHRAQHPPKAKGAKGKHAKSLVNGENEHGPKWEARYATLAIKEKANRPRPRGWRRSRSRQPMR